MGQGVLDEQERRGRFTARVRCQSSRLISTAVACLEFKAISSAMAGLPTIEPATTALALATIAAILGLKRLRPRWPGMMRAVAGAAAMTAPLDFPGGDDRNALRWHPREPARAIAARDQAPQGEAGAPPP